MDRADYAHWNSADVARLLALLESERRYYQEIVAGVPVGLLVVTSEYKIASANAAVRRIFGLRSAEPVRGSLELLLPRGVLDRVEEVLRTGRPLTGYRVKSRSEVGGRDLRVGIRPMTGWDLDNPREALITVEDLTEVEAPPLFAQRPAVYAVPSEADPPTRATAPAPAPVEIAPAETTPVAAETEPPSQTAPEAAAEVPASPEPAETAAEPTAETVVEREREAPDAPAESAEPAQPASAAPVPEEGLSAPLEQTLINQLDAAVWAFHLSDSRFIFVSEGAARTFGYAPEHWVANPSLWSERIAPADRERILNGYRAAIEGDGHFSAQYRAVTPEGRTVWIYESARVAGTNEDRRIVGLSIDISARRAAENGSVRRERLDALKALSARLAHDLNNLLMIVTGYSEDALSAVSPGSTAYSSIGAIRTAGERLSAISGQLRTFATFAPPDAGAVELNDVVSRVRANLQEATAGRQLTVQGSAAPLWVRADAVELELALRAALTRALATVGEGGEVSLLLSEGGIAGSAFASIEIRDNATPLGEVDQRGFFEQLLGAKQSTDVLARAYLGVEHWGGQIRIEPLEAGNLLTIRLLTTEAPAAPEPLEQQAGAPAPAAEEARGPQTILVVEDEGGIRALVRKILERHGYTVLDAAGAEAALTLVEDNPIDLIITDVVMPNMNGQELVQHLKVKRPGVRVLFISGYTEDSSLYTRDLGPGTAFLQKPFTLGALVTRVREVLNPDEGQPQQ